MKKYFLFTALILLACCKSIYERAPQMRSFPCELAVQEFYEKAANLSQLEGFFVAELDTTSDNCLIVLQKNNKLIGSEKDRIIEADQIRIRYSKKDKTVWYSTGIYKNERGKISFSPPNKNDAERHNKAVSLTLDRLFVQCNPGQFPNRP